MAAAARSLMIITTAPPSENVQTITASWRRASQEVWREAKHWPPARCQLWRVCGGECDSNLTQRRSTARRPETELWNKGLSKFLLTSAVRMPSGMSSRSQQQRQIDQILPSAWGSNNSAGSHLAHHPSGWQIGFTTTLISRVFLNLRKSSWLFFLWGRASVNIFV